MPESVTTIIAALIGAIVGSGGAVLLAYFLTQRGEKYLKRDILVQRYLLQLQDALEALWYRLNNLAFEGGGGVMSPEYREITTLYALGKVLAFERIFTLEGVYPQFDAVYPGFGTWLKQNSFDLKLQAYLKSRVPGFYQYDRFLLAEAAIVPEGNLFRASMYFEFRRRYEFLERDWLKRATQVIQSFTGMQNIEQKEQMEVLLGALIANAKYIAKRTDIGSSLTM